jgi:hypothetical protein
LGDSILSETASHFKKFITAYPCSEDRGSGDESSLDDSIPLAIKTVISQLGGKSFDRGIYRVLRADEVRDATLAAQLVFPEFAKRIVVFGYDWLGRQFASDTDRVEDGIPQVLMLEVGAGQAMQIPANPVTFHERILLQDADAALSEPFYHKWQGTSPTPLRHDQCVGYIVPLFLGGVDDVENLEVTDLSVYWSMCGQIRRSILGIDTD